MNALLASCEICACKRSDDDLLSASVAPQSCAQHSLIDVDEEVRRAHIHAASTQATSSCRVPVRRVRGSPPSADGTSQRSRTVAMLSRVAARLRPIHSQLPIRMYSPCVSALAGGKEEDRHEVHFRQRVTSTPQPQKVGRCVIFFKTFT